jgi:hypothetical protein
MEEFDTGSIIEDWLVKNEFDGLSYPFDDCKCYLSDGSLFMCDAIPVTCIPIKREK